MVLGDPAPLGAAGFGAPDGGGEAGALGGAASVPGAKKHGGRAATGARAHRVPAQSRPLPLPAPLTLTSLLC
eukprot:2776357-Rhodomonas_salina.2